MALFLRKPLNDLLSFLTKNSIIDGWPDINFPKQINRLIRITDLRHERVKYASVKQKTENIIDKMKIQIYIFAFNTSRVSSQITIDKILCFTCMGKDYTWMKFHVLEIIFSVDKNQSMRNALKSVNP